MKILSRAAVCGLLIGAFAVPADTGQQTGPGKPPLVIESMYGPDLYRFYCATCHGRDAKGKGPAAEALKVSPSDLTTLAQRRHGTFPSAEVELVIRGGTAVTAHGSGEMPVWGPIFYALDPADARVTARIKALVTHLASIQEKSR